MCGGFAYTDSDGNGNANSDGDGNCDGNGNCHAATKGYAYATTASHTEASAVKRWRFTQLSLGTREGIREFPESR